MTLPYWTPKGSTNVSTTIRIVDATTGVPELAVVAATTGLVLEYRREGAVNTSLATLTNLAALTTAHTDKGMLHIGNGYYRVDVPDAAFATGVDGVLIHGLATDMVVIGAYHHLTDIDIFDAVRAGLTALPNAAAEAAGGLYTRGTGAGQINQPTNGQIDVDIQAVNGQDISGDGSSGTPFQGA